MDIQHCVERWLLMATVILVVVLTVLFALVQGG